MTGTNDVQQATQSIVKKCDAIYIPTDNTFASAMPTVYGVVTESKTPVICGESGMVEAGGLATLGINYHDLGYQTGLMAIKILKGRGRPGHDAHREGDEVRLCHQQGICRGDWPGSSCGICSST